MNASPFRYFTAAGLHPAYGLAALAAVTLLGIWTIAMSPAELDSALGMLLFVQMFLASTGFLPRARRGHFDPLLTSTYGRRRIVVAHWLVSVAPCGIAWLLISIVAWTLGSAAAMSAIAGPRLLAMAIVSVVAWAAGFALGRGTAGALWAAGLVAVLLRRTDLLGPTAAPLGSAVSVLQHAAVLVLCPFLLLSAHTRFAPGSMGGAAGFVTALLFFVAHAGARIDCYLRDRS